MKDELEAGADPATLFLARTSAFSLEVQRLGSARFRIAFGCHPGPLVGDGGVWRVEYDAHGDAKCVAESQWIS
jgi:hypothetical protein